MTNLKNDGDYVMRKYFNKLFTKKSQKYFRDPSWPPQINVSKMDEIGRIKFKIDGINYEEKLMVTDYNFFCLCWIIFNKREGDLWYRRSSGVIDLRIFDLINNDPNELFDYINNKGKRG